MPAPRAVRTVRRRTIGSGTRLLDEVPLPRFVYHGGRAGKWAVEHWRGTGLVLATWAAWGLTGSLLVAVVLIGACWCLSLYVSSRRIGVADAGGLKDALAERQRRATLRQQWPLACKAAGLMGPSRDNPPRLRRVRATAIGTLEATVASGHIGVPVPAIQKQTVTLAEVIGCREVVVTQTEPGVARIAFHWLDPVGRGLALADLPLTNSGTLAYGIRQDGTVASVRAEQSILIGGLTGMGKSNITWVLLASAIRDGIPVHLYTSDPKGGVELDALEAMVGKGDGRLVKVRQYAKTPAETVKMIAAVESAMHARQYWMKEHNVRKITPDATNPLVVLILDETLPLTDLLKKGTDSPLGRIAYTGRAAGYVIWANSQVAQVDSLGRFRDLIPQRICLATPNPQVTDSVLGQGSDSAGAHCDEIRQPGVGYSYSEGQHHPRKFRAAKVTDEESRLIAAGMLPQNVVEVAEVAVGERDGKTALYRWYHADAPAGSRPGYIGTSYDVLLRERQHNDGLRAFMDGDIRREVEWWPTRKAAEAAEKAAIVSEAPTYNRQHNGSNPRRKVDQRVDKRLSTRRKTAA